MLREYISTVRRNHALEHATVTLLLNRLGPDVRLVGRANCDGFLLFGDLPTDAIKECVAEALVRLKRGEGFWAVTPLCGTNIATAGFLASVGTMLATKMSKGKPGRDVLPNAVAAGMIGVTLAQPVGRLIQKHITTSPDLADFEIVEVEARSHSHHKVKTVRRAQAAA